MVVVVVVVGVVLVGVDSRRGRIFRGRPRGRPDGCRPDFLSSGFSGGRPLRLPVAVTLGFLRCWRDCSSSKAYFVLWRLVRVNGENSVHSLISPS